MPTQQIFDAYAEVYEEKFNRNPLGRYQREQVQAEIAPYLSHGKKVLDVGCGPGSDFAFYQSLRLSIDALDISPRMAELAREKAARLNLNARVFTSSLEEFQADCSYDLIILNFGVINVFEYLPPVLEKLRTLLAPDGILILVSMPPFHLFSILGLLVNFDIRTAAQRVFKKKAALPPGRLNVYYYRGADFARHFRVLKKIHLCPLLPSPDQYRRRESMRKIAGLLMGIDRRIAGALPDILGGDHVCYILSVRK